MYVVDDMTVKKSDDLFQYSLFALFSQEIGQDLICIQCLNIPASLSKVESFLDCHSYLIDGNFLAYLREDNA